MEKTIPFRTESAFLKKLAYNDCVYAWLLLHSHFNKNERHNYIYKNEFTFKQIGQDIHRHRDTVSKRFKELIEKGIIYEYEYNRKIAYKMAYFEDFEELDGETVLGLLTLPIKEQREELIKTYAYLLARKRQQKQNDINDNINRAPIFYTSANDIILAFGHSNGHQQTFDRIRFNLTVLQGAGIIEFEITPFYKKPDGTFDPSQMRVYKVNKRASEKWLGNKVKTE